MSDAATTIRDQVGMVFCPAPTLGDLTKEQVAALIAFKSDLTASLDKLYQIVPQTQADKLLKQFVATLP